MNNSASTNVCQGWTTTEPHLIFGPSALTGPVTGFVISGARLPTVYVSGDKASLDVVRSIAAAFGEAGLVHLLLPAPS